MATKATGNGKGRPRKNASEKAKAGTLNVTREKEYANRQMKVVPMDSMPPAPEELGEIGRRHWELQVRELHKNKMLSAGDLGALAIMCNEYEEYWTHRLAQRKNGSWYAIKGEDGKPKNFQPHPVHFNGNNHCKNYMDYCRAFGITPDARARIGLAAQDKPKTAAAELLKNLGKTKTG